MPDVLGIVLLALLWFTQHASASADTVTALTAISIPVRPDWLGNDGQWSPVSIRVGTPPQWVEVFPSTAGQETWVIGPDGCDGTQTCIDKRGGLFMANESTTWSVEGFYELGLDPFLDMTGVGYYGLDSIALSDTVSIPSQIVSVVNDTNYWDGVLGLGIKGTNFTGPDLPTFLTTLGNNGNKSLIPSLSYGYTAGAYYRLKGVPSSLVVGGYDQMRFQPNNATFLLSPDQEPVLAINQIVVSAASPPTNGTLSPGWTGTNPQTLLDTSDAALFTIDTTTNFMWLPESVCSKFEKALDLVYDESVQLYTFANASMQARLQSLVGADLSFEFHLADTPQSKNNTVTVTIPYATFNLALSYGFTGFQGNASSPQIPYFPLRKAANDSQYVIGRVFLQETYLTVDYQRNNFSIAQALFPNDYIQDTRIVSIYAPGTCASLPGTGLPIGVWMGIAFGAAGLIFIITSTLIICLLRRRHRRLREEGVDIDVPKNALVRYLLGIPAPTHPFEIDGKAALPNEILGTIINEADGTDIKELPGSESPITHSYHIAVTPIDHDPSDPIELPSRHSAQGFYEKHMPDHGLPEYALPPPPPASNNHLRPIDTFYSDDSVSTQSHYSPRSAQDSPVFSPLTPVFPRFPSTNHGNRPRFEIVGHLRNDSDQSDEGTEVDGSEVDGSEVEGSETEQSEVERRQRNEGNEMTRRSGAATEPENQRQSETQQNPRRAGEYHERQRFSWEE